MTLPSHQWWADAWREVAARGDNDGADWAQYTHYLADQNSNAAARDDLFETDGDS